MSPNATAPKTSSTSPLATPEINSYAFTKPFTVFVVIFYKMVFNSTIRFLTPFVAYFSEDMDISVEKFSLSILLVGEVSSVFALSIAGRAR